MGWTDVKWPGVDTYTPPLPAHGVCVYGVELILRRVTNGRRRPVCPTNWSRNRKNRSRWSGHLQLCISLSVLPKSSVRYREFTSRFISSQRQRDNTAEPDFMTKEKYLQCAALQWDAAKIGGVSFAKSSDHSFYCNANTYVCRAYLILSRRRSRPILHDRGDERAVLRRNFHKQRNYIDVKRERTLELRTCAACKRNSAADEVSRRLRYVRNNAIVRNGNSTAGCHPRVADRLETYHFRPPSGGGVAARCTH